MGKKSRGAPQKPKMAEPRQEDLQQPKPAYMRPVKERGWFKELLLTINMLMMLPHYFFITCLSIFAILYMLCPPNARIILYVYAGYCAMDTAASRGGWTWVPESWRRAGRDLFVFRWLIEYFDMELVKECDLDPKQGYLFLYHPHGIIGIADNVMLCVNTEFDNQFPGMKRHGVTLNAAFRIPVIHSIMLFLGYISADKKGMLSRLKDGATVVLCPGGAAEALYAHPGTMKLVMNRRRGFIKLAREANVAVVPVIGFGENEMFPTVSIGCLKDENRTNLQKMIWSVQQYVKDTLSFSTPVISNPIANRIKVSVAVGSPLKFDDSKSIDECHADYLEHLSKFYETNKSKYGYDDIVMEFA